MLKDNSQLPTLISQLYTSACKLLQLGEDGSPVYADDFRRMNTEVFELTQTLFGEKGSNDDEEARICLTLLLGFSATIYSGDKKETQLQSVLDRSFNVLSKIGNSTLKCELLMACYQEVEEKELMDQAKEVIMSWGGRELTEEEVGVMERWNEFSKC